MFETDVAEGVLRAHRSGTRWLSTGPGGGYETADAAYNCTVPEGFGRTDLDAYVAERRHRAGFDADGPAMLTGVAIRHARRARLGPVEVVATAGISNPAVLPVDERGDESARNDADGGGGGTVESTADDGGGRPVEQASSDESDDPSRPGTVNLVVGTTRALDDGALATLLGTAVEAKAATLLAATGFPGTTSDAAIVGCDPTGEPAAFAGSATPVGRATRVCVRDALRASLAARYGDGGFPDSVTDAEYGVVSDGRATTSRIDE